jgi:hypothetical protein
MIGDMKRVSSAQGLHCLADCGLAMSDSVRLFDGLDLGNEDEDEDKEDDDDGDGECDSGGNDEGEEEGTEDQSSETGFWRG